MKNLDLATSHLENNLPAKGLHPIDYSPAHSIPNINWRDINSYSHITESEDLSIWTWEFLRRNRLFQKYVDELVFNKKYKPKGLARSAPEWHLVSLKHYKEQFGEGRCSKPAWTVAEPVDIYFNTTYIRKHWKTRNQEVQLEHGQIAVVIDLNHGLLHPEFLSLQFQSAQLEAREQLKRLVGLNTPTTRPLNVPLGKLLTYLRIADAMSAPDKPSSKEIAVHLLDEKYQHPDMMARDLQKAIHPQIKATRNLIYELGYLRLLLKE